MPAAAAQACELPAPQQQTQQDAVAQAFRRRRLTGTSEKTPPEPGGRRGGSARYRVHQEQLPEPKWQERWQEKHLVQRKAPRQGNRPLQRVHLLYFGLFCMTIFGLFQTQIW